MSKDAKVGEFLDEHQYAFKKGALEDIVHQFHLARSVFPEDDTYLMDAKNAFNSINRKIGLWNIMEKAPYALPFLRVIYGNPNNGIWFPVDQNGKKGEIKISMEEGFHQGDVMGTWLYIMTLQLLIRDMYDHIRDVMTQKDLNRMIFMAFYVDDGNITGPWVLVHEAIKYLQEKGPLIGFTLNCRKGQYLMGERISAEMEQNHKAVLVEEYGIISEVIKVHSRHRDANNEATFGAKILGSSSSS